MKLLRWGPMGHERPGLLTSDGVIRDLSAHVPDITGATLTPSVLARLREIDSAISRITVQGARYPEDMQKRVDR